MGAGVGDDSFHQPGRGAGAAQVRFGLDMNQGINAVTDAIIREHQHVFFGGLETMLFDVVDHLVSPPPAFVSGFAARAELGSRYIQGKDRPMGTIQKVPARA